MAVSKLNPSAGANDFNVQLSGSYVKVDLSKEYSAGAYSITSSTNDISLDIYAINADGSSAGSTATKSLVTTKGFSKLIIVGGTNGDILSFAYKQTFTTSSATNEVGIPPIAISTSPSALPNVDDSTTVSGYNFAAGMTAAFVGTDNVSRSAKSVVVGSSTSAIITRPDVLPVAASPYDLNLALAGVTPPTGSLVGGLVDAITAGNAPSWTTTSPLPVFSQNQSYTTTLVATDPDPAGSIVSYTIVSGSLPSGLNLASTSGVISGTATSAAQATFTVRATNQDGDYADRAFTLPNAGPSWVTAAGALATFTKNVSYSTTVSATDDSGSVSYSIVGGALPTGVTISSTSGVIAGTPTSSLTASITVRAQDVNGNFTDRAFTIPNLAPSWVTSTLPTYVSGGSYSTTLSVTEDGTASFSLIAGSLPSGFTLTSTSGVISGTSTSTSTASFTIRVTDDNGSYADRAFTLPIVQAGVWSTITTSITNVTSASDVYGGYYNGYIYQGGGQWNASPNQYPTQWYKVDVNTGVATILASAPQPRDEMGSIWVGNKHYVVVGYNQNGSSGTYDTVMIYNDATNSWSLGAAHPGGSAGLSHNGTDGTNLYSVASGLPDTMTRYNIANNTWTTLASVSGMGTSQGYRMPYSASRGKFYNLGYNSSSPAGYNLHIYDVATNSWTRKTATIPRTYDSPFQGGDNYAWGFDINAAQTYLYIYGYDALYSKSSPARSVGAGPADKILRYDIVADTWSVTSYTDVGYSGGASGTDGSGAFYMMSGFYVNSSSQNQYPRTFSKIYLP